MNVVDCQIGARRGNRMVPREGSDSRWYCREQESEFCNVESCRVVCEGAGKQQQARQVRRAFLPSLQCCNENELMPWAPVRRGGIQRACKVCWVSAAGSPCSDRHRRDRDSRWHNGAAADRAAMAYRVWRQDEAARHLTPAQQQRQ